ncbi:hypothetical protein, partial [Paraburkholderia caribensis]|uniref:hypothetical protein n=1 Tax=Paraburkholderia caribensis TaxID=75105 RepID=UPI001C62DF8D
DFMDGSCSAAVNRQLASCKTRHLYLARTRHSHIALTDFLLIIKIMSNHNKVAANQPPLPPTSTIDHQPHRPAIDQPCA